MTKVQQTALRSVFPLLLAVGVMPAATLTGDLSKYRSFQLGTDLATVAKQAGADPAQAKMIHSRPALIQELDWRPQPVGPTSEKDPARAIVFGFYNGELFQIAVDYDRYQTEGLTVDDFIDAISIAYGPAARPMAPAKVAPESYGDQEEILAQWQDAQYRFDLIRSSYGSSFKLVGVLKRLEVPAQAATVEAKRLDDQEAPQREAARLASDEAASKTKSEQARLVNKPKFRP